MPKPAVIEPPEEYWRKGEEGKDNGVRFGREKKNTREKIRPKIEKTGEEKRWETSFRGGGRGKESYYVMDPPERNGQKRE